MAQTFLDRFVRQNIAEIDEIPWREQLVKIKLPPAERALYVELKNHLEALDMRNNAKAIKSKCKSENDRENRLAQVLGGSDGPDEALMKRCAHYDMSGGAKNASAACGHIVGTRRTQLQQCQREIVKQTAYARDAIAAFEKLHPRKSLDPKWVEMILDKTGPAKSFEDWRENELSKCGDDEANEMLLPLVEEGLARAAAKVKLPEKEKNLKDRMAWTRDQVHLLRRLQKEMTGRVRSLRFFENVRKLQVGDVEGASLLGGGGAPDAKVAAAKPRQMAGVRLSSVATEELGLLSCCGHFGPIFSVRQKAEQQECVLASCTAAVRPSCVVPVGELGVELAQDAAGRHGAKLSSVIRLIRRIPADERILVFVQFQDLLQRVFEAFRDAGVPAVQLAGTPIKRSAIIESFQSASLKKDDARVLVLNLRDESAAGANLTAANHAIFLHPLLVGSKVEYDSCDTQAVGRIRRYGQGRIVQLYRFLVSNSIDEEVFAARRDDHATMCSVEEDAHPIDA